MAVENIELLNYNIYKADKTKGAGTMGVSSAWKVLMVIADKEADVRAVLDDAVRDGTIAAWREGLTMTLRHRSGKPVSECLLSDLALDSSDDDVVRARRFWNGAIDNDGSMSTYLLSVIRMNDEKRNEYVKRYKTLDRYVQEMSSLHADAVLLPDGSFRSNDGLRGCNQLHDWSLGFCGRFIEPLLADESREASALMVRMFEYQCMGARKERA